MRVSTVITKTETDADMRTNSARARSNTAAIYRYKRTDRKVS